MRKLVDEPKKKNEWSRGSTIIIVIVWGVIGFGVITQIFSDQFPDGWVNDLVDDLRGLGTYDVCVNWIDSEKGGECLSWKADQRLESCPKIVIDKLDQEYCILD